MTLQSTNLNVSPFFDDYSEGENFHRILFRPRSVQARELNQAQTILQDQINRLGRHLFEDGAMVIPGGINTVENQSSIGVTFTGGAVYDDIVPYLTTEDLYIRSVVTGQTAKLMKALNASGADPICFFIEYVSGGALGTSKTFIETQAAQIYYTDDENNEIVLANLTVNTVGTGIWVKILEGIYFVRGHLVRSSDQDYVVSKFTSTASARVGFQVNEIIVDETMDNTLFSNAIGTPNFKAPGASRLKFELVLTGKDDVSVADPKFIELVRYDQGVLQSKVDFTAYAQLEKTLAQRTFEESGDYTVNPFQIDVRDHIKDTTHPDGVYPVGNGGLESKYVTRVKPGIAYVKGYRVQNVGTENIAVDKARDSQFVNNSVLGSDYGSYIVVQNVKSFPDINITKRYNFTLVDGSTVIGDFCIRAIRKEGTSTYRLYIFDTTFTGAYGLVDAKKIRFTDASNLFTADLVSSDLFQGSTNNLVYRMPYDVIKTLKTNGSSDTSYTVLRSFDLLTNGAGVASVSLSASEIFGAVNSFEYFIGLTGAANVGTIFDPTGAIVLGGTPVGRALTITLAGQPNKNIKVIAPVIKQNPAEKTKTLQTATQTLVFTNQSSYDLAHADIFSIDSIIDINAVDRMKDFTYDDGQRANWYQNGKLKTIDGQSISNTVTVIYKYFAHSPGDYFTVDSYSGLERSLIPKFRIGTAIYNLADTMDFRPLKDASGVFTTSTVFGEINKPGDNVRFDLSYYQPRVDSLYVDADGKFGVKKGISSDTPLPTEVPSNALRLVDLLVPAYTEDVSKIKYTMINNRRYTMRDIGTLEKRIENVEYYTALNMLENKSARTQIIDPITGNNRFKNGFSADGFKDTTLADVTDPEWGAALDFDENVLKPSFVQNFVDMQSVSGTNYMKRNDLALMSYTSVTEAIQPYATSTSNVNPYAVFTWSGTISLTPASDVWKDVFYNDPIITNGLIDNTAGFVEGVATRMGTQWIGHHNWIVAWDTYTTFVTSDTGPVSQDDFLSSVRIPYMRPIPITYKLTNFRPFTRLYPFWDGVSVASQVTPAGGAMGDAVITDAAGSATGVYLVPCTPTFRFSTGNSVFRFTDSEVDSREDFTTGGDTQFFSNGTLETRQVTITNTRTVNAVQSQGFRAVQNIDPIAQTFRVNSAGGAYVTNVDVFFSTKAKEVPVIMQIRPVVNGFPSSTDIMPFGEVTLTPDLVNISADGKTPTTFTFSDPIYLVEGAEYAIVLLANTQEYNAYIAEMGGTVIGEQVTVAKQPHIGVFLVSSNGTTWNAVQNADLKFTLRRAEFDITNPSTVVYNSLAQVAAPMSYNSFNTVSGSNQIVVKLQSHGLKVGDKATFAGVVGNNGFSTGAMNAEFTVTARTLDTFTVVGPNNATFTGTFGGAAATILANYTYTDISFNAETQVLSGTEILWEYSYLSQASRSMTAFKSFQPKIDALLDDEGVVLKAADVVVRATLKSTRRNLSPSIDDAGMGCALIGRRIDPSEEKYNYVSRQIRFDNPNTSARFYVGAKLPGVSTMKFYYKPIVTTDVDLSTIAWVELQPVSPLVNDAKTFVEYEYQLSGIGPFVGYKIKIVMLGSEPTQTPELSDIRSIALA